MAGVFGRIDVQNNPVNWIDPFGLERKPGKTPPVSWPQPPRNIVGKKPKWNPQGYWDGKGRKVTWDDRSHGAGIDRGSGPQGGHWDDENSDNRWDENGNLLPVIIYPPPIQGGGITHCPTDPTVPTVILLIILSIMTGGHVGA